MISLSQLRKVKGIRGATYRLSQIRKRAVFAWHGAAEYARLVSKRDGERVQIAAVTVGRNDDFMPDFVERLYATIAWDIRYLVSEVVFVEWNPPPDRELLSFGLTRKFPMLRAFVVPVEIHDCVCRNPNIKLLEYHAKNVGIRRARSPWIVATNADAALGFDIINKVLTTKLSPDVAWTAERVDVPWREGRQRAISLAGSLRYRRAIPYDMLGTGEFILASKQLWERARGYDELMVRHRIGCDVRGTAQMLAHGATIQKAGTVLHLAHPTSCTENLFPHHGEQATPVGVPYHNREHWGLADRREVQLAERVWRLE